jgi:hypothetical protein
MTEIINIIITNAFYYIGTMLITYYYLIEEYRGESCSFCEKLSKQIYRNNSYSKMRNIVYNLLIINNKMGDIVKITLEFKSGLAIRKIEEQK